MTDYQKQIAEALEGKSLVELPELIERYGHAMFQRGWLARDQALGQQETSRWMYAAPGELSRIVGIQALRGDG